MGRSTGYSRDPAAAHAPAPARGQDRVDGVVHGDDPDELALSVDDRHGQQVVAGDDLATSS